MIYLDNNATTIVDSEVIESMLPYYTLNYGNPSSSMNLFGDNAKNAIMQAKTILTDYFHAESENNFIFTSGATESNNLAFRGIIESFQNKPCHVIVSSIEHKSILQVCKKLEKQNVSCTFLPIDSFGRVSIECLKSSIQDNTVLISVMGANNEIGTIEPIKEISEITREHGILFHSDITQLVGEQRINVDEILLDMFSFSAHKIHGPKGVGCLYANAKARKMLSPLIWGGNQQLGLRSGTLNVPGIMGMVKAVEILDKNIPIYNKKICYLRNLLIEELQKEIAIQINGDMNNRICNNLNITFQNVSAIYLASKVPDIAFSSGSACLMGDSSYVLKELGLSKEQCDNTVRFGLSRYTTKSEILYTAKRISEAVKNIIV